MAVTVRAAGTIAVTGGPATLSPGLPAGTTAGDLLLLLVGNEPLAEAVTCSGYSVIAEQDALVAGWGRLSVFTRIATGSGDAPTTSSISQAAVAVVLGIQVGTFDTVSPVPVVASQQDTTLDNTRTFAGLTAPRPYCLIVYVSDSARDNAAAANPNGWSSFTAPGGETTTRFSGDHTNLGNGHGLGAAYWTRVNAGAFGTGSASTASSGNMPDNNYTICIQPPGFLPKIATLI